jgi:hypothetical protein
MISIEKVRNGFVLQINEDEEEYTIVCQQEYNSMNVALAAVFRTLMEHYQDNDESIKIKLDVQP